MNDPQFGPDALRCAESLLELAIAEDLGSPLPALRWNPSAGQVEFRMGTAREPSGDLTSEATIPVEARGVGRFVARASGVVAGLPVLELAASRFGMARGLQMDVNDGAAVQPGTQIATLEGPMRDLLALERTALNFLQRLSGVASLTAQFVQRVRGTRALILDTRKTTPGWRALEKYAVRCGGGMNHRHGLYDAVLIKDNHLAWLGARASSDPIAPAVERARRRAGLGTIVEVEVDSLKQLDKALKCGPDIVLIDNFDAGLAAEAARRRDLKAPGVLLEVSGGVDLDSVAALARTGIDRISIGALTHSAPALDIGLDFTRAVDS